MCRVEWLDVEAFDCNNGRKRQMGFNSALKVLKEY